MLESNRCNGTAMNDTNSFSLGLSHYEIEKRRAIKSNRIPLPPAIRQRLCRCLADAIINSTFESVARIIEWNVRQLRLEAFRSETQESAFIGNDPLLLNIQRIISIGVDQKRNLTAADTKDEWIGGLENQVEESLKSSHVVQPETKMKKVKYDYCDKIYEAEKSIEASINKEFKKQVVRLVRDHVKTLKTRITERENELTNVFCYYMALERSGLYEVFQDEKFESKRRWAKALDEQKETNGKNLKRLRVSLEAEHVQNLTEVELSYQMQDRRSSVDIDDAQLELDRKVADEIAFYDARLCEVDKEFSKRGKEVLVFKKKLEYVLNDYIDLIKISFQKWPSALVKEQLFQAKSLLGKIKNIEIENREERERTPKNCICIEQKTSYGL